MNGGEHGARCSCRVGRGSGGLVNDVGNFPIFTQSQTKAKTGEAAMADGRLGAELGLEVCASGVPSTPAHLSS